LSVSHTPTVGDFVFRSADRMRIDGCTNAIAREGLSLCLQCEHEALLDHYVGLLLKRLRQDAPEHSIEVYFPTNTDALLARFNEALARQSVQQATSTPTSPHRAQIWIVHDAQAMPEAEIQLLARLIQNFPGANIRAILLMTGPSASQNNLAAFGRKILRWEIEAPNAEQAQAALDIARTEGRLQPVQQLLKRINRQAWAEDAPHPVAQDAADFADAPPKPAPPQRTRLVKQQVLAFHEKGQEALAKSTQLLSKWDKNHTRLLFWVMAALTLSTMTMLWLQPQSFGLKAPATRIVKSQDAAPPFLPAAPVADSTPVSPPGPSAAPQPEPQPKPDPSGQPSPTTPGASPQLKSSATDIRQTQTWVKDLDPQSFLLQYGTAKTFDKALELLKSLSDIKNIAIVEAYHTGDSVAHFVIVSGPYAQVNEGLVAARKPGIPKGSWVRSTRSLQTQIKTTLPKLDTLR
jgi:hypothetical protein